MSRRAILRIYAPILRIPAPAMRSWINACFSLSNHHMERNRKRDSRYYGSFICSENSWQDNNDESQWWIYFYEKCEATAEWTLNYYIQKTWRENNIMSGSIHKIRKTHGSKLLADNVDESIIFEQMGHKNISRTHGYCHYDISPECERM